MKQHLSALRMLFDWLVTGHVLAVNPAHAVRGPKHVVRTGKTPVLTAEEARSLLDSIRLTRKERGGEVPCLLGMVRRRAETCGIRTRIGNHTFRATGITAYLKNGGSLEMAQHIAGHESPRTTKLYDRRRGEISLDEVERIAI